MCANERRNLFLAVMVSLTNHQHSDSQPFSSHLIIKILHAPKNIFFCYSDQKNRDNCNSFTPDSHCCVGCGHFFNLTV